MGKRSKKERRSDLQVIADNTVAKKLYVALMPLDSLLHDLHEEIEDGQRSIKDPFFIKGLKLRRRLIFLLEKAVTEECF